MTAGQHIDYDALQLEALRGVVKGCLAQVSRTGLLGDHHFYIAFNTQAPGVGMSKRLKEKYPSEMTIVLQHRFWDLAVDDDRFEVKLTFDGIPERLVIPFKAVKVFYDPSVPYGLQFEESDSASSPESSRNASRRAVGLPRQAEPQGADVGPDGDDAARMDHDESRPTQDVGSERSDRRRSPNRKLRTEKPADRRVVEAATADSSSSDGRSEPQKPQPGGPVAMPAKPSIVAVSPSDDEEAKTDEETTPAEGGGAKIFDLSKFRGKK